MMTQALKDILVVTVEQAVAAPFCTSRLAAAGARVIKVERKEGDFARGYDQVVLGESAYFVWLNHGKESVVLDLKNQSDAALLHRMIAQADVFVQNLAPGSAKRAGFGSEDLRAKHPRLITCDITGYGDEGPLKDLKAYDLLIQCETGLAGITGTPEGSGRVGVSIADLCCGLNAQAAILQALYERERTGRGKGISTSLFAGLAELMTVPLLHYEYTGKEPPRVGLNHPSIAPYGVYTCGDGKQVVIAIQNEREWKALCEKVLLNAALLTAPCFASNVERVAHRPVLDAQINAVIKDLDRDTFVARLWEADVAFASVNDVGDLARHPQLTRTEVHTPSGSVSMPSLPWRLHDETIALGDVPALGEHTAAIRTEFQ